MKSRNKSLVKLLQNGNKSFLESEFLHFLGYDKTTNSEQD